MFWVTVNTTLTRGKEDLLPQQQVPATSAQTDSSVALLTVKEEQAKPGSKLGLGSAVVPDGQDPASKIGISELLI